MTRHLNSSPQAVTVVEVAGQRVRVTPPLRFKHFGEVTMGVDQRAEVGGWWVIFGGRS